MNPIDLALYLTGIISIVLVVVSGYVLMRGSSFKIGGLLSLALFLSPFALLTLGRHSVADIIRIVVQYSVVSLCFGILTAALVAIIVRFVRTTRTVAIGLEALLVAATLIYSWYKFNVDRDATFAFVGAGFAYILAGALLVSAITNDRLALAGYICVWLVVNSILILPFYIVIGIQGFLPFRVAFILYQILSVVLLVLPLPGWRRIILQEQGAAA